MRKKMKKMRKKVNKEEIKRCLMLMRTPENEDIVNQLLGTIDMTSEEVLKNKMEEIGGTEKAIRAFIEKQILEKHEEHIPINEMFSYGVTRSCVHLHLPIDLHQMNFAKSVLQTMHTVNLYFLDAIDRIKSLRDNGYYKFQDKDKIYMISPLLKMKKILEFFKELDFETRSYSGEELKSEEFLTNHPEAMLARRFFSKKEYVGTAEISFDKIASQEWQNKKQKIVQKLEDKGISIRKEKGEK